jgi:hypothetical protein
VARSGSKTKPNASAGFFVGAGFGCIAIVLYLTGPSVEIPIEPGQEIDRAEIKPGIWRVAMTDPPMINIGTLNQRCSDCHTLFTTTRDPDRALNQHTEIALEHGANDACLNCHDKDNREMLALEAGNVVGFNQVELLCAKCHGPIYRDWIKGSHGKTIGYWNTDLGESVKLSCTQCHEPHHPGYRPIVPLPGPNTLRMGDQSTDHGEEIDERNPLMRWRINEDVHSASDSEHGGDD